MTTLPLRPRHALSALVVLALAAMLLAGCRSSRHVETGTYLSSKVRVTLPMGDGTLSVSGNLRMVGGERVQLSLLMPILHSEVLRIEVNPEELIVVSRMTKQYLQADRQELSPYLPRRADFDHLQRLLLKAANKDKVTLSAQDLGIPKLDRCRLTLTDFSTKPISLNPTTVSAKYERIGLDELLHMLAGLMGQ